MEAIVLSIGDELVLGQTVDANSAWLSARLAEQGIATRYHQTLADELEPITAAIQSASQQAPLVLITGGLGPTEDDLTRQALAEALASPLVRDADSLAQIEAFFAARGKPMPERNKVQANRPQAAAAVLNDAGTAPGIHATLNQAAIYAMPGVPREMRRMYDNTIKPALDEANRQNPRDVLRTRKLNTFGQGESDVAELLKAHMARDANPTVGTTVTNGIVSVRLRARCPTNEQADAALDRLTEQIEQALGPIVFGRDEQTLQQSVIGLLKDHALRLATAESCTGGLIGAMLTDVAGSSEAYLGGWVTYTNAMKQNELGVAGSVLAEHGAVSEPVVRSLAEGALHKSGADLAVSVSGVAGPGGGTDQKPVGTVWIGLAGRASPTSDTNGQPGLETEAMQFRLPGDRPAVRDRAAKCALQMIRLRLLGEPITHLRWGNPAATSSA